MLQVEGTANEGESEFTSWLRSHGVNNALIAKITSAFNTVDELRFIDVDQMNDVLEELQINSSLQKIKFKYVCAKAKAEEIQNVISREERKAIQGMQQRVKEIEANLRNVEYTQKNIDDEVEKLKQEIESIFDRLSCVLSNRKSILLNKLNEVATEQKERLKTREKGMNESYHISQKKLIECQDLIRKETNLKDIDKREENILKIAKDLQKIKVMQLDPNEYKMNVDLNPDQLIKNMNDFGNISIDLLVIPQILAIENDAKNTVKLKWKLNNCVNVSNNAKIKVEWKQCEDDEIKLDLDFNHHQVFDINDYNENENALNISLKGNKTKKTEFMFRIYYFDSKQCSKASNCKSFSYQHPLINFVFNEHQHADNLQFINNNKVKKINETKWSTFIFGDQVTDEMCDEYNIFIKSNSTAFFLGFISHSIEESIKDWNDYLGHGPNKEHSTGYYVDSSYNYFRLFNKDNNGTKCSVYSSETNFKKEDTFRMCFNFLNDKLILYHNGNKAETLNLDNCKRITAAFSLIYQNEEIEVTNYSLS